ncbi:MAG: hypothetical protein A4E20_01350 [Nitrospira sp. SG-bin2]|uniref:hypothetical protein n=1 Tax=Nitrospira cf. moscoviensis SBR1015 TaxID=96242 RepID=UPI000A098F3F|nr:hypothetical protein [Nitrospira cf. moscoviensis SBR1015]OQW34850.1 MAG: hypothetical protein A4E20_01350 [Nitrospira sp. SG-bin2]
MKQTKTKDEALMDLEGYGRFNLKRSLTVSPVPSTHRRTRRGPRFVGRTCPVVQGDQSPVLPRAKMVPRLVKDGMGNDVRTYVPYKRRKRK